MRCLLHGHDPVERKGVGEHKGQRVVVCAHCGNVLSTADSGLNGFSQTVVATKIYGTEREAVQYRKHRVIEVRLP